MGDARGKDTGFAGAGAGDEEGVRGSGGDDAGLERVGLVGGRCGGDEGGGATWLCAFVDGGGGNGALFFFIFGAGVCEWVGKLVVGGMMQPQGEWSWSIYYIST